MHAGDALWRLYGCADMLERLYPAEARVSHLVEQMRSCAGVVGAHISVPEPTTVDRDKILESMRAELPAGSAPPPSEPTHRAERKDFKDPETIEAAKTFIGEMVNSGLFEWADMVGDVYQKLDGSSPFFTFKQARAILNIADRGEFDDGSSFMDQMEDAYPEATNAIKAWADEA